ncbi:3-hydroxyacyl-CoA dehydrogenase NAD-binding domain-containing protein [Nostocoides veronense]|uniref:3-hydroxyacyl-CoA dehydrogenase NAD-binding domain-containing protein n=1 Tax=Nostocoides veronense TaxID=330836 RepID=A0ABN2LIW1_9MICO
MTATLTEAAKADFPDEVVTNALVQDITLPHGAGVLALITLDNGFDHTKPNTFGPATIAGLAEVVTALRARAEAGQIQAVGITGKPFIFAVGADLTGVPFVTERQQALDIARAGHAVFADIMDLPVPTFAFINGAAMGGGVEIALSCDYRTISAGVPALALPECFLGLVPGWGGCYLLPNLVGIRSALQVIIENPLNMNKMLKGPQAFKLGIADAMFAPADFLEESLGWAASVLTGATAVERAAVDKDEAAWNMAIDMAKALVDVKTGGKSPAPYRALELLRGARTSSREDGFAGEDEALADLLMGDQLRAGLYAFDLIQKRAKRPAGAPDKALARPVTKVGVVGAGLMAGQLALLFAQRLEVPVVMTDLDQERVDKGLAYVRGQIADLQAKGRVSQDGVNKLTALVTGTTDKAGMADADFVIEAVFEEMSVKKRVFAELEQIVTPECVLASNTSSLSLTEMAADLEHPERVVGFHFFNPVAVMPLLEIIPGEKTDDAALATAFAVGKGLKKTTILVKDSASFIVNRILGRFMGDYSRIVDEGTPSAVADQGVAGLAPMPPFVLLGLVGPAIALHNSETLHRAFGDRFYVSPSVRALVEAKKTAYDPSVQIAPENPVALTADEVKDRVLSAIAEEVGLMLKEGVAQAPMDIDLALITGAGFQFWNGGITPLLDREGISEKVNGARFLPPGAADVRR